MRLAYEPFQEWLVKEEIPYFLRDDYDGKQQLPPLREDAPEWARDAYNKYLEEKRAPGFSIK